MDHLEQLNAYRERLLDALRDVGRRGRQDNPGQLQVFVNHEGVGVVDCTQPDASFAYSSRERTIQALEIRTESGTLVGGLCSLDVGMRNTRFPLSGGAVDVQVHNRLEGCALKVSYQGAPAAWWARMRGVGAMLTPKPVAAAQQQPVWGGAFAFAQVVLAVGVMVLLSDRVVTWLSSSTGSPNQVAQHAMRVQFDRVESQLSRMADSQHQVIETAQRRQEQATQMAKLIESVAGAQQNLATQVGTVKEDLATFKGGITKEFESGIRVVLRKAEAERAQIRGELQSMRAVNETLVKEVASLESKSRELHARLALANLEMAKANANVTQKAAAASTKAGDSKPTASDSTQVAEALREAEQSFMFWVAFQDGTPEQSIEELIQKIHGRKGPVNSGWYPVEVTLQHTQDPPDRFLDSIRSVNIVKAVATSQTLPPKQ